MKTKTLKSQKAKLDKIFSYFIRLRDSDENGFCKCVTCGQKLHWKKIHNGHFISRSRLPTRFHEQNCASQCCGCNTFRNGEPQRYFLFMEKTYGRKAVDELIELSNKSMKLSMSWYEEQIAYYEEEVRLLMEEKC